MSRWAAKLWARSRAIDSVKRLNEHLASLESGGNVDTLGKIEAELIALEETGKLPRLPIRIQKRLQATIKKNQEMIATLKDWEIT